jgi:hypothetical protein
MLIGYGREKRQQIVSMLKAEQYSPGAYPVIDIGATDNPWTAEVADYAFDLRPCNKIHSSRQFIGDVNDPRDWQPLLDRVAEDGKFAYAVCSHLLEDIALPKVTLEMLPRIASAGYICSPSRFLEAQRIEGPWRGYIHHRWILCEDKGELMLVPKIPYFDRIEPTFQYSDDLAEIQIEWRDSIQFHVLNNGYLGPNVQCVEQMYQETFR